MAFRSPKKPPEFADLKGILSQGKDTDNAIYQTIQILIERLDQSRELTQEQISTLQDNILKNVASKFASYHTKNDETAILPNSWQLLAGGGVVFDDSIPNKRTIRVYCDTPLTDGDVDETNLIFALGECIIVQVPYAP